MVEAMKAWLESSSDEVIMELFVGAQDGGAFAIVHGCAFDGVGVEAVEDHDIIADSDGGCNKASCLICEYFACLCVPDDSVAGMSG